MKSAELTIDQANASTDLADLCYSVLSPRLINFLRRQGISTVGDLIALHSRIGRQGIGRAMRRDLSDFLADWDKNCMIDGSPRPTIRLAA
jgi:hypothetical protein